MTDDAPRNGGEALAFLKSQKAHPTQSWRGLCLSLQRQARALPAVYPSALAAQNATPEGERVYKVGDLRSGMVAYSDDPNDSNPYGHVYAIAGWAEGVLKSQDNADKLYVFTNDAPESGKVGIVPITYFRQHWGDGFRFGATWLNGYNFADFDAVPEPEQHRATLGDNYRHAIEDIQKAIRYHRQHDNMRLVYALEQDLVRMKRKLENYSD